MADFFQGMQGLGTVISQVNAVTGPGFAVSEDSGAPLVEVLDSFLLLMRARQIDLGRLAIEPPLGMTPAARVYKPFIASIAADPVQGSQAVLKDFQQKLLLMKEQITEAMKLYQANEENNTNSFSTTE
ncbi:hypothetical protein [Saccharothrix xinjiangensis]|uniref:PE family protein n=1 Tax=Saccharothrix xinjiangensis TaxID=204798 RepID=A0ABV9YES9_9PSEU